MSSQLTFRTIFAGRYRVLRCIGQGGMGAVYEVIHLDTERHRALKVMHPHILQSDNLRERFQREAKVAAHIVSEHIVDVFDAGVDEATGSPFMVMELLRGEEIGRLLKRVGRLPPGEVVTYLYQAALALDATHKASIVHRDIKPANLFLTERADGQPRLKVLDFGVAKLVAESGSDATAAVGTPVYMAPEQFNPNARLTGAADIFALGMVAYTLLTGRAYWAAEAKEAGVYALAAVSMFGPQEPASIRAAAHGVALPAGFDAWFSRVTAQRPDARHPTATEAVRALGATLSIPVPSFPSGQVWEGVSSPSVDRAPVERLSAPRSSPSNTVRSPDLRSPYERVHSMEQTTMLPAIQQAGVHGAEPTQWNRKMAIVGAVGALGLGMLIGLNTNALRSNHAASGAVAVSMEAGAGPAVTSAPGGAGNRAAAGVAPPVSAGPPEQPPVASAAAARSATTRASLPLDASAPSTPSAAPSAERRGIRRPAPKPSTTATTPKPASRWPQKYTRE